MEMEQYHVLLKRLLAVGDRQYNERTGHLMLGKAGHQSVYDLRAGFPATTTKPLFFRGVVEELFWMARGERNVKGLIDRGIHIWDGNAFDHYVKRNKLGIKKHTPEWNSRMAEYIQKIEEDPEFAAKEGDLGPIYGHQWRNWTGSDGKKVDQLKDNVIGGLKNLPGTRYALLNAYKVDELEQMSLPACHALAQFNIFENKYLDVQMFQRSCDVFLGVPFNTASYPVLATLIAQELGLEAREFYHSFGNVHIYTGVAPRSNFLRDDVHFRAFQKKVASVSDRNDFMEIREWYLKHAPAEGEGQERKDHIPFILQQLGFEPKKLPVLEVLAKDSFFELIKKPAKEAVRLRDYNPQQWDSKAEMAA